MNLRHIVPIVIILALPLSITAQTTARPISPKKGGAGKTTTKTASKAMHGKNAISAIDTTAKTLTIGDNLYKVTDSTKISAGGKLLMLDDLKVGDNVYVSYTKEGDVLVAISISVSKEKKKM